MIKKIIFFQNVKKDTKEFYKDSNDELNKKTAKDYFDNYLKLYEDDSLTTYTDKYCIEHQKDCLFNYDLNMKFFSQIKYKDFEKIINKLKRKFKKLIEITDLTDYKEKSGIYILILDDYKQMYIGQTEDINKRITQHWRKRKEFDRLIFGSKETSILSIDSFGALDTTRILVYETKSHLKLEEEIVDFVPKEYLLNRTKGGDRGDSMREIAVNTIGSRNNRKLI